MDPTLYEEINRGSVRTRATLEMKTSLSLDLTNFPLKRERVDELLGSCDLELPSPELERFLLQPAHDGGDGRASGALSTPTTQILFPKSVTEEQEAYARGFIDALEQLHRSQGAPTGVFGVEVGNPGLAESVNCINPISSQSSPLSSHVSYAVAGGGAGGSGKPVRTTHPYSATVHHVAVGQVPSSMPFHSIGATSSVPMSAPFHEDTSLALVRFHTSPTMAPIEAPQTVPRLGDTPPLSPINMDDQERIKLERKRARNRMAARKCRTRKLEQIATLELRVAELKSQNAMLATSASTLKNEVVRLELQLREHMTNGTCFGNLIMPGQV